MGGSEREVGGVRRGGRRGQKNGNQPLTAAGSRGKGKGTSPSVPLSSECHEHHRTQMCKTEQNLAIR